MRLIGVTRWCSASGDLTHRGQRDQHERVAAFLRRLGRSVLAVPGNHDIPYTFPARFTAPGASSSAGEAWSRSSPALRRTSWGPTPFGRGATSRAA